MSLKRRLREWRAQGRFPIIIGTVARTKYFYEHARDYRYASEVRRALAMREFGTEPQSLVAFTRKFGGSISPIQDDWEAAELVRIVRKGNPKTVLEIGTARGGTLFLLCQSASDDATIISVDLPSGAGGGGYMKWKNSIFHGFKKPQQTLHLVRANSHLTATRDHIASLCPSLDFIMIDGDHTYAGVKRDFELYAPLVSPGGAVAFHDILPNPFNPEIEVDRFWQEVKNTGNFCEIIRRPDQRQFGIGLLSYSKSELIVRAS
jgi:predicted O-methyltransferase YrrM